MKNNRRFTGTMNVVVAVLSIFMASCQSPRVMPEVTQEISQAAASVPPTASVLTPENLPQSVMKDILSGAGSQSESVVSEPRFHVSADAVEVRQFFAGLFQDTEYSVVVHPTVNGTVTLDLKGVTLEETLDVVGNIYGYDVQQSGKVFQVLPPGLRTEIIPIDYLMMKRSGISSININAGGVSENSGNNGNNNNGNNGNNNNGNNNNSNNNNGNNNGQNGGFSGNTNGTRVNTENKTDFWKNLQRVLTTMLGMSAGSSDDDNGNDGEQLGATDEAGRMVVVSPLTGLVTVRAFPEEIAIIKEFLGRSEQILQRQVVIEAKIVEVSLDDEYQQGINWQAALAHSGSTDFILSTTAATPANTITSKVGGVTSIRFQNRDFFGVVNLLETQGNVQVLSSPRITVVNNQKAVIKVGQDEYFVTEVSNTTVTGNATTTTPEISLTPFFSGIALDVTPQIDDQGFIILHVHPSVIETAEQQKVVTLNEQQFVLPLARSNIRESDTIIKARSKEIVVIGGLMQSSIADVSSRTPGLGAVPILGQLFTSKNELEQKKELVILLKATVVGAGTWQQQLKRSSDLLEDWYPQG